jgi:hypothetical protein
MKTVVVAKYKFQLGVLVGIGLLAMWVLTMLLPLNVYLMIGWAIWGLLGVWLSWSWLARPLFGLQTVRIGKEIESAFDRFDESMDKLSKEESILQADVRDAVVYQREIIKVLTGFIDKAESLKAQRQQLVQGVGEQLFYDPEFGGMLQRLDPGSKQATIESESGILSAQEDAYRQQAALILNRVMQSRAAIARQQLKLKQVEAAQPILRLNKSLGDCGNRLAYLSGGVLANIGNNSLKLLVGDSDE